MCKCIRRVFYDNVNSLVVLISRGIQVHDLDPTVVQFCVPDQFASVQLRDECPAVVHQLCVLVFILAVEYTQFSEKGIVDFLCRESCLEEND